MRRAVHACAAALLLATSAVASASTDAPAGGTFTASTAGLPAGAALGGWSDDTDGTAGQLTVDFASAPVPAGTSVEAVWTSKRMRLAESDEARTLASFAAADYLHNAVTDAATDLELDARVSVDGA